MPDTDIIIGLTLDNRHGHCNTQPRQRGMS